jgi:hypothetical protein
MLPLSVQVPASVVLLAGGAIACFGGYRLFKLVLAVYGFILGALVGSSMAGAGETWVVLAAATAGGTLGALALVAGYFIGVAIIGAGLGALIVNLAWKPFGGDPHVAAVVVAAAIGAFVAMSFQRYVIIVGTSFGGAWTMLVGAAALMLGKGAKAASAAGDMWVVYPGAAGPDRVWVFVAWIAISLVGMYVQLHTGAGRSSRKKKKS